MSKFSDQIKRTSEVTKKSVKEVLSEHLQKDLEKIPKKIFNQNDLEMTFDPKLGIYVGKDESGKEWAEAPQHTQIPYFYEYCQAEERKGNIMGKCNTVIYFSILEDGKKVKCRKCGKDHEVKLNLPESSMAYDLWQLLKK